MSYYERIRERAQVALAHTQPVAAYRRHVSGVDALLEAPVNPDLRAAALRLAADPSSETLGVWCFAAEQHGQIGVMLTLPLREPAYLTLILPVAEARALALFGGVLVARVPLGEDACLTMAVDTRPARRQLHLALEALGALSPN